MCPRSNVISRCTASHKKINEFTSRIVLPATRNINMGPHDVRRILRAQPHPCKRNLFRRTATLHRYAVLQSINATVFAAASVNVDVGETGRHSVLANAFGGEHVSIAAFERRTVRVERTHIDASQGQTVQLTASYGRLWVSDPTWRDGLRRACCHRDHAHKPGASPPGCLRADPVRPR